jgi:RNA polymerase sigma-70 factor (ECF subfamily)
MDPLIVRAKQGDKAALAALLSQVAPSVHRFGLRMCRSESDADDVLQDTLLSVATHLEGFEGRSAFSSWVFALARSACARRRRGLKNRPPVEHDASGDADELASSPEQDVEQQELSASLTKALSTLSEEHREVLVLRDMEGLTAPEAAAALGISVDALKSRLHRARAALRSALKPVLERDELPRPGGGAACRGLRGHGGPRAGLSVVQRPVWRAQDSALGLPAQCLGRGAPRGAGASQGRTARPGHRSGALSPMPIA